MCSKVPNCQKCQSYPTMRLDIDLPTLRYRHFCGDMIKLFKILKYYDSDTNEILQRHSSSATRGHLLKLD